MNPETPIQNDIKNLSGKMPGLRLFRNFVGVLWRGTLKSYTGGVAVLTGAHRIRVGVEGSSDLTGWYTVTVTPEMVGKRIAVFTSIEVKQPGKKARENQDKWIRAVIASGGIAGVATSSEQAEWIIKHFERTMTGRE